MVDRPRLPDYDGLFHDPADDDAVLDDAVDGDVRSVYSPAAYLADLLQLVDDHFTGDPLAGARPDLAALPLGSPVVTTEVPYLDIVDDVVAAALGRRVGRDAYAALREVEWPLSVPFDRDDARYRTLLRHAGVRADVLYRTFAPDADADVLAREYLGLSQAACRQIVTPAADERAAAARWGLTDDLSPLHRIESFRLRAGLTRRELHDLLADPSATVVPAGDQLRTPQEGPVDWSWFDWIGRIIRLARHTALPPADVDLVLGRCAGGSLGAAALRALAVLRDITVRRDVGLDVACALVAPLGDGTVPDDLFDRVFNGRLAQHPEPVLVLTDELPERYRGRERCVCAGDVLALRNKPFRARVASAVGLTEAEVADVVVRFRERYGSTDTRGPFTGDPGVTELSLWYRLGTLTRILDVGLGELFDVLDAIVDDRSVHGRHGFGVLIDVPVVERDLYRVLAETGTDGLDASAGLRLVPLLDAIVTWTVEVGLTGTDLAGMLGGPGRSAPEPAPDVADALHRALSPVLLTTATFTSTRFSARASRLLHEELTARGGVVSTRDARLLRPGAGGVPQHPAERAAILAALARLDELTASDLRGLGRADRFQQKIFTNLVLRGYLRPDGSLVEEALTADAAAFVAAGRFDGFRDDLFDLISQLRLDEAEEVPPWARSAPPGEDADATPAGYDVSDLDAVEALLESETVAGDPAVTVREVIADPRDTAGFFPSDLAGLVGLPPEDAAELYDNLVFNGYVDATGLVRATDFFADVTNADRFRTDADIGSATAVWRLLRDLVERFDDAPLALDPDALAAALDLPDADVATLAANLRYNGYVDDDGCFADKRALLDLGPTDLQVGLEFHRRRRAVLAALQDQVAAFRASVLTCSPDTFAGVADEAVAALTFAALARDHLDDGRVPDGRRAAFLDGSAVLDLGTGFEEVDETSVRQAVAAALTESQRYRMDVAGLVEQDFDPQEIADLRRMLTEAGDLDVTGSVAADRIGWFATVTHGLTYRVPGFGDYATDLFLLLHAAATEVTAAIDEVRDRLDVTAHAQRDALSAALADAYGIRPDTAAAAADALCGGPGAALDELAAPAIAAGPAAGTASRPPADARVTLLHRRLGRFGRLAAHLDLDGVQTEVVFRDQDLVGAFPESLVLPPDMRTLDALLVVPDAILAFEGGKYHTFDARTHLPVGTGGRPLRALSASLDPMVAVDAAFTDAAGTAWLLGRDSSGAGLTAVRYAHTADWTLRPRVWGAVRDPLAALTRIDGAVCDRAGRILLFVGDRYLRYSDGPAVADEGYPRTVAGNWARELSRTTRPDDLAAGLAGPPDAVLTAPDGRTYLFRGDHYVEDGDPTPAPVAPRWGRVDDRAAGTERVDAAFTAGAGQHLVCGDRVLRYRDCLENPGVRAQEGYPQPLAARFPGLPPGFASGVDAVLPGPGGTVDLFRGDRTVRLGAGDGVPVPTSTTWGRLGPALSRGVVDSGFVGLDGRTYLFSGPRYLRYSGSDYTRADAGYPREIAADWGGLTRVEASFVLDGRSYLFGTGGVLVTLTVDPEQDGPSWDDALRHGRLPGRLADALARHGLAPAEDPAVTASGRSWTVTTAAGRRLVVRRDGPTVTVRPEPGDTDATVYYVRYSSRRAGTPDEGFPRPLDDNWWNLPADGAFDRVDAVFTDPDGLTHLFRGDRVVTFDGRRRWWSRPRPIAEAWDGLPFDRVDAAFVGTDGATYVFSGTRHVRCSGDDRTAVDDGYPARSSAFWGQTDNVLAGTGTVDAVLAVDGLTYLFSGDQFVRYSGGTVGPVDNGYPKSIAEDLRSEPRFAQLAAPPAGGVDAAVADRGTVYLFSGRHCHAVSTRAHRAYPGLLPDAVRCAHMEDGALLVEDASGWSRVSSVEGTELEREAARPRVLRGVPDEFRSGLDAVLHGTDGGTYLFRGPLCHDVGLRRTYPLAEDWGRPRNTVADGGRVDAAFVGPDGRTHVFCGDQFVTYSGHDYTDAVTDGPPRSVADVWAGLASVALAYVEDGVTHLFSPPDDSGAMRHVRYSGPDRSDPDPGYPRTVTADVWGLPAELRADGFDRPSAVLVDGGTVVVLAGSRYVRRHGAGGTWSEPRPLTRLWPGLPLGGGPSDALDAAFVAADGSTYFFAGTRYVRHAGGASGAPASTAAHWGRSADDLTPAGGTPRVDAAFVDRDGVTYLFSGDRYARYSTPDYAHVDAGYPRTIRQHLRAEPPFAALTDELEGILAQRASAGPGSPVVDAVVGNDRNVYLFLGRDCHVLSRSLEATYGLDRLGPARNHLAETGTVDAALVREGRALLFSGDQYVRYSDPGYRNADDGYPRTIAGSLAAELGVEQLPEVVLDGVDAAVQGADGVAHLFRGEYCVRVDGRPSPTADRIAGTWGAPRNAFAVPGGGHAAPDAAFRPVGGPLYVFRDDQYVRYSSADAEHVDEGYPRTIADGWGDLPPAFERGLDGAFTFEGRTYLTRGDDVVRYSDPDHRRIDPTYPQALRERWTGGPDLRLSDVREICRFAALDRAHPGPDGGLSGFLAAGAVVTEPFRRVAGLFGWDAEEVAWAQRHGGFLASPDRSQARLELETVNRLVELFTLVVPLGGAPSAVHDQVWVRRHGTPGDDAAAAGGVARLAGSRLSDEDRTVRDRLVHDDLNVLCRDALVAALVAHDPDLTGADDLFDRLLIDVRTGPAARISRVREAIAATQLFLHRYFLGLTDASERTTERLPTPADVRAELRRWWGWMESYRVWEANRKAFLYPENYLRPELRTTQTPAFRELSQDLLQGEMTDEKVTAAFRKYLDEYTEVSRLTIAGGYVHAPTDAPDRRRLVLFGRTRTDPRRFYFRSAEFGRDATGAALWQPWSKVDLAVTSDRVYPVFAFGRVFVFWSSVEKKAEQPESATFDDVSSGGTRTISARKPVTYRVTIRYSFQNLNGDWVPAQEVVLRDPVETEIPISGVDLRVGRSDRLDGDRHENIVISCAYYGSQVTDGGTSTVSGRFGSSLTPELYTRPADGQDIDRGDPFPRLFDEGASLVPTSDGPPQPEAPREVVTFGGAVDADGPSWFSVDYKGGSFLCKPAPRPSGRSTVEPQPFPTASKGLPPTGDPLPPDGGWFDAGTVLPDMSHLFLRGGDMIEVPLDGPSRTVPIDTHWAIDASPPARVVGAVTLGGTTYVLTGDRYAAVTRDEDGALRRDGELATLLDNPDGLPRWPWVETAFTAADGVSYFLDRDGAATSSADVTRPVPAADVPAAPGTAADPGTPADPGGPAGRKRPPRKAPAGIRFTVLDTTYDVDDAAGTYTARTAAGAVLLTRPVADLLRDRLTGVTAAWVADDRIHLAAGRRYWSWPFEGWLTRSAPPDGGGPRTCVRPITAVLRLAGVTHVVSGSRSAELPNGAEPSALADSDFRPLLRRWGNLPDAFLQRGITGAVHTRTALYLWSQAGYVRYPVSAPADAPYEASRADRYEIVRLTTATAQALNTTLFTGGVAALLDLATQELDEEPSFSVGATTAGSKTIRVRPERVRADGLPASTHLDFDSANGIYYWEIFFHAPVLIAHTLNAGQRFDAARRWYEYVFDPTRGRDHWRFLPFRAVDVGALVRTCRTGLAELARTGVPVPATVGEQLDRLDAVAPAFTAAELPVDPGPTGLDLGVLDDASVVADAIDTAIDTAADTGAGGAAGRAALREAAGLLRTLGATYQRLVDRRTAALQAYLDDPFDPHAVAALRTGGYRRWVVLSYIDNLLDWGDMLFGQFTSESVEQARLLYVLAHDLLGPRPERVGTRPLDRAVSFGALDNPTEEYELVLRMADRSDGPSATVSRRARDGYFSIPENTALADYWDRVAGRLHNIRASLTIRGEAVALPSFEPPIDPSALVAARAAGLEPGRAAEDAAAPPVPHFRSAAMLRTAQDMVIRLAQFANDLQLALEKQDVERLGRLQAGHETEILELTRDVKKAQVAAAEATVRELAAGHAAATTRHDHFTELVRAGKSGLEIAQLALTGGAIAANAVGGGLKTAAAIAYLVPDGLFGPFILGVQEGGTAFGHSMSKFAEVAADVGQIMNLTSEVMGILANQQRMVQEWTLQRDVAVHELAQIEAQQEAVAQQVLVARRDLGITERQVEQARAVSAFMTGKFSSAELYGWLSGRLSEIYFQAYRLAVEVARGAERAHRFENGLPDSGPSVVKPVYWDSRHNGLLAADGLALDLARLAKAQLDDGARELEITKRVSLRRLDPMALLRLRTVGSCEITLGEALFDQDFPGHFRRRVRTVSVAFQGADPELAGVNATLTQTGHRTVLEPDPAAVKGLLEARPGTPASVRVDWRVGQSIALSQVGQETENNGVFELRFDDERYLPFEGTGAVSTWRLEVPGRRPAALTAVEDVLLTLRYSAEDGGGPFAAAVRGMLKPYTAHQLFDLAADFPDQWQDFQEHEDPDLLLPMGSELFPDLCSRRIESVHARFVPGGAAASVRFVLNGNPRWTLTDGVTVPTAGGLSVEDSGGLWRLRVEGDRTALESVVLVVGYRAGAPGAGADPIGRSLAGT